MQQPHVGAAGGQGAEAPVKPRKAGGGVQVGKAVDQARGKEHIEVGAAGGIVPGVQQRKAQRRPQKRTGEAGVIAFPDRHAAVCDPGSDHNAGHIGKVIQHIRELKPGLRPFPEAKIHAPERHNGDKPLRQPVPAGPHQPYKHHVAQGGQNEESDIPGKADQQLPMEKAKGHLIYKIPEGGEAGGGNRVQNVFDSQAPLVNHNDPADPLQCFPKGDLPHAPAVAGDHRKDGNADFKLPCRDPAQRQAAGKIEGRLQRHTGDAPRREAPEVVHHHHYHGHGLDKICLVPGQKAVSFFHM